MNAMSLGDFSVVYFGRVGQKEVRPEVLCVCFLGTLQGHKKSRQFLLIPSYLVVVFFFVCGVFFVNSQAV